MIIETRCNSRREITQPMLAEAVKRFGGDVPDLAIVAEAAQWIESNHGVSLGGEYTLTLPLVDLQKGVASPISPVRAVLASRGIMSVICRRGMLRLASGVPSQAIDNAPATVEIDVLAGWPETPPLAVAVSLVKLSRAWINAPETRGQAAGQSAMLTQMLALWSPRGGV